jgi:molybdenum cofactor cytidylyltransferase
VVTGHARDLVRGALAGLPLTFVDNQDYATGLASSLRTGIAQLPPSASGAIILLGDMPLVSAETINQILAAYDATDNATHDATHDALPGADAIVPSVLGNRGNPVLIARSLFPSVARLAGDEGARRLLQQPGVYVVEVAVASEGISVDVDTREVLDRWQRRS